MACSGASPTGHGHAQVGPLRPDLGRGHLAPCDWVRGHALRTPDAPAIADRSARLSYAELATQVVEWAGHLQASGVGPGSRVLVALPNRVGAVVAGLAINAAGGTAVEVSRTWSTDVLAEIVSRSGVHQAIVWERDLRTWHEALDAASLDRVWVMRQKAAQDSPTTTLSGHATVSVLEDGHVDPDLGPVARWSAPEVRPQDPALILYTSGSTGAPHGVIQTHGNIDANTRSIVGYLGLTAADRALLTLPLSYCYGRSVLQTHLYAGGSVFLDDRMAFPRVVMETLGAERCTGFAGVPTTFELIRRQGDISTVALPHLRYVTQAGGAMAPDVLAWAREAFAPAPLYVMYGQTEATARLSYLPPECAEDKPGSIGQAIPGVELRVVDDSGSEVPAGQVGELVARGQNVTPGYLDDPEATAHILHDGWLWTGDLAARDDEGFFFLKGRLKEFLKVAGHRVSPVEIEQVIARHPDVSEAAVYGATHDILGEAPVAVVVPRSGVMPSARDLERHCRERLPAHQVPTTFHMAEALPRNEAGKLLRAELPDLFATDRT